MGWPQNWGPVHPYEWEHSPNLSNSMSCGFFGGAPIPPVPEGQRVKVCSMMEPWSMTVGRSNFMGLSLSKVLGRLEPSSPKRLLQ